MSLDAAPSRGALSVPATSSTRHWLLTTGTNHIVKKKKKKTAVVLMCPLKFMEHKIALHHTQIASVTLHLCELVPQKLVLFHLCDSLYSERIRNVSVWTRALLVIIDGSIVKKKIIIIHLGHCHFKVKEYNNWNFVNSLSVVLCQLSVAFLLWRWDYLRLFCQFLACPGGVALSI